MAIVDVQLDADFSGGYCVNEPPEKFFPERGTAQITARNAKAQCKGELPEAKGYGSPCPRLDMCREYALARRERTGVWGGTTERDRAKILRARRVAEEAAATPVVEIVVVDKPARKRPCPRPATPRAGNRTPTRSITTGPSRIRGQIEVARASSASTRARARRRAITTGPSRIRSQAA